MIVLYFRRNCSLQLQSKQKELFPSAERRRRANESKHGGRTRDRDVGGIPNLSSAFSAIAGAGHPRRYAFGHGPKAAYDPPMYRSNPSVTTFSHFLLPSRFLPNTKHISILTRASTVQDNQHSCAANVEGSIYARIQRCRSPSHLTPPKTFQPYWIPDPPSNAQEAGR